MNRPAVRSRPWPRRVPAESARKGKEGSSDTLFLVSMLTPIFAVFGALAFVSGWSYMARYLDYFGLSISDAEEGTYAVLVHAIYAIKGWRGCLIVLIYVLIGALLTLIHAKDGANRYFSLMVGTAVLAAFPLTSWLAADAGIASAEEDAGDLSSLPNITITSSAPSAVPCRTGKLLGRKDAVYLIARVHSCPDQPGIGTGIVTVIPTDTVIIDHHVGVH